MLASSPSGWLWARFPSPSEDFPQGAENIPAPRNHHQENHNIVVLLVVVPDFSAGGGKFSAGVGKLSGDRLSHNGSNWHQQGRKKPLSDQISNCMHR